MREKLLRILSGGKVTVLAVTVALVLTSGSAALAASGGNFLLGRSNFATSATALAGQVRDAAQSALLVKNTGGGSALELKVGSPAVSPEQKTAAPMKVNSQVKVDNLNADELDGKDSSALWDGSTYHVAVVGQSRANGPASASVECDPGDEILNGGYGFNEMFDRDDTVKSTSVFDGRYVVHWLSDDTAQPVTVSVTCADFGEPH